MIYLECSVMDPLIKLEVRCYVGESGKYENYGGEYEVTPKDTQQVLETKNKNMKDNVTVKGIPTYEISNDFGTTFIIGEI